MNNPWAYGIVFVALVVLSLTRGIPRAWLWIGIGAASFVISSVYWDLGDKTLHPIVTFACDALVCVCIHAGAKEKWELGIFLAFLTSVFCSLLKLTGFIPNQILYASLLELCNFVALLWIGGVGIIDLIGKHEDGHLHRIRVRLHSSRDAL